MIIPEHLLTALRDYSKVHGERPLITLSINEWLCIIDDWEELEREARKENEDIMMSMLNPSSAAAQAHHLAMMQGGAAMHSPLDAGALRNAASAHQRHVLSGLDPVDLTGIPKLETEYEQPHAAWQVAVIVTVALGALWGVGKAVGYWVGI